MNDRTVRFTRRFALPVLLATSFAACAAPGEVPSGASKEAPHAAASDHTAPAAAAPAAAAMPDRAKVAEQVKRYFEGQGQIPADDTLDVGEMKPSQVPGLYDVTLKLSRGEQSQELKLPDLVRERLAGDG